MGGIYYINKNEEKNKDEKMLQMFENWEINVEKIHRFVPTMGKEIESSSKRIRKNIDNSYCKISTSQEILNHTNTYRLILEKIALYNDTQWYIVLEGNYLEKIFFLVLYFQPIFFGWYDLFFREKLFLL